MRNVFTSAGCSEVSRRAADGLFAIIGYEVRLLRCTKRPAAQLLQAFATQPLGGPDAKTGGSLALYAIASGDDHMEIVTIDLALNVPHPFSPN